MKHAVSTVPILAVLILAALAIGCGNPSGPPDIAPAHESVVSLNSSDWYFFHSKSMPEHPSPSNQGAFSFQFPNAPGWVGYLQTPFQSPNRIPKSLVITFRVTSSPDANYDPSVDPEQIPPATFHVFLRQRGDEGSTNGRWWSGDGGYVLGSRDGEIITLRVPLTPDKWTNVSGQHNEAEFYNALGNVGWVGLTFGGKNFWGHGVNMREGSAEFTLIDYRVE